MEYGPDNSFRLRDLPTGADYAHAAADSASKEARKAEAQLQRLVHLLAEKGVLTSVESLWVAVGDNR